jgi:hypothetical protein
MASEHKHHVIPISRGGSNEQDNIVFLSPYDHALHHALDFLEGGPEFDFRHEAWPLLPKELQDRVKKERGNRLKLNHPMDYPGARQKVSARMKGKNHPMYGLLGEDNPNFGSKRTTEQCKNISKSKKGVPNPKLSEYLRQHPHILTPEKRRVSNKNLEKYRNSGRHSLTFQGRKWWVNQANQTKFEHHCPGPDWQPGRKWRN